MLQTLFNSGCADGCTSSCLRCGIRVPSADINVAADTALCRKCGATYRFSELVRSGGLLAFDPVHPPQGASFQVAPGGFVAYATTRSAAAWILVPFFLVWSGFSLGGIYGAQFQKGHFDLYESLFGLPFVLGTLAFGTQAVMSACGRVTLARHDDEASVFQGVGVLGWRCRYRWSDLDCVLESDASYGPRGGPPYRLIKLTFLSGMRPSIKFGTLLPDERRWFMISVLRSQLAERNR
jgi:hypothetical protein